MALVVHPHFHHRATGVTRHTFGIVPRLQGHEVVCVGRLLPPGLPRLELAQVLDRARREDVVWHAHRNNELLYGLYLRARRPRLKVVATRHGSYPPSAYTRWLSRQADALITLNAENAGWMQQPSVVVPHGVDTARFTPPVDRAKAYAALGLGGTHGVGVVGRVRENKGQLDFAQAVGPLLPAHPGWRAALVGLVKPEDRGYAEQAVARTQGALVLAGEHADIERWYQGLSVVVQPSHGESFGLTFLEGMASGCCVVSAKLFHLPDFIEHGRTGFLYPPRDVAALRTILEELLADPARAAEVGARAAVVARERFGIEREARAIEAVYAQVLAGRPRG